MPDHKPSKDNALPHSGMFRAADVAASPALRERAQREVRAQTLRVPEDFSGLSPEAGQTLLHELRVHQIELELQNDELLRTQYDLEASRARYFDLYDVAPVGYLTLAENGLVLEANLTAAGLLERTRDAIVNQPFTRFILPEDQDIYYHHNKQLSRSGMPQVCELRLLKSSGVSFWGQLEARIAHDVEGRPASRTVLSEITERRRAEQTLRLSEARHRTLFENSADALVTLGPPGWHFTSANAAAIAMFGAEAEADFVERAPSYYSPERQPDGRPSAEKAAAMIEIAMRTGSHTFEWTHRRLPADEFCATVTLVRMEANGAPLLQATVRDDSEERRKRAILAQTERLASMGMLAASVGHEINNPLAYVLSNVESLAKTLPKAAGAAERFRVSLQSAVGDDALAVMLGADSALLEPAMLKEASDQARDALDGVQRITRISKVLSAFARTDTPELSEVDVKHAIELAVSMASNQLRFRAKLTTDFQPVPAVYASEGKLSQVFLNLLINASHAMEEGDVLDHCISVRTWSEGKHVLTEVKDTGKGIPPENMARIFEPFFTTKPIGVGSGLGLSICRSIIAELGGAIEVQSEVGKGTSFVIRLPMHTGVPKARRMNASSHDPELSAARGRILVVDDEAAIRSIIKRLLPNHEVVTVSSGRDAQALLDHDEDFDLILCDLMMPEFSGMDLHQWLLQHNPTLAKQVVFISGGAFGRAAAYLPEFGNIKLDKPFDTDDFKRVVSEQVQAAQRASSRPPRSH